MPFCIQLIRRIAYDNVELHIVSKQLGYAKLYIVSVNERVGVVLKPRRAVKGFARRAAI
jgi:hypothetical protein